MTTAWGSVQGGSLPVRLQFLDRVFQVEFSSLQFQEFQIACGGMVQFRLYLLFEHLMATHEFCEMAVQRHPSTPYCCRQTKCDTKMKGRKGNRRDLDQDCLTGARAAQTALAGGPPQDHTCFVPVRDSDNA